MRCMGTVPSRLLSGSLARELVDAPLLELLRCPVCHAALAPRRTDSLACTGCGRSFGVEDGIPLMLHEDLPGAREKLGETAGWVEKARAEGWYEPDDAVDAVLPFVNRELGWDDLTWLGNAHSFELLLGRYIGDRARPARARGRRGQGAGPRASGSSATASSSPPTSSSTRRSASAAAPSTATSAACRPTASTSRSRTRPSTSSTASRRSTMRSTCSRWSTEMARVARPGARRRRAERGHAGSDAEPGESEPGGREGARDQRARALRVGVRVRVHARRPRRAPARAPGRLAAVAVRPPPLEDPEGRADARHARPSQRGPLRRRLDLRAEARRVSNSGHVRRRLPLPRAVREPLPPRPPGEVPRLGARRRVGDRQPAAADGRLPARLRRVLHTQFASGGHYPLFLLSGLAVLDLRRGGAAVVDRGRCSTTRT